MMTKAPTMVTKPPRRRARGQTLVEFTIVIFPFFLLLCGLFDAGRAVYMNSVLSQAAREGARLGAVEAGWMGSTAQGCNSTGGPRCPADLDVLKADVLAAVNRNVTPFGPVVSARLYISCDVEGTEPSGNWTFQSCTHNVPINQSDQTRNVVSVRVELQYEAITPVVGQLISPVWLAGSASMVIN
jgi:hypothetical protein